MTCVAEMRCAEAEEDSDRAAVATFVLEKVGAVFRTHLCPGDVRAGTAHKLCRVVVVSLTGLHVTAGLASVVRLKELFRVMVGWRRSWWIVGSYGGLEGVMVGWRELW